MQRNTMEIVMGAIVLLAAAGFVSLAYEAADLKGTMAMRSLPNLARQVDYLPVTMCAFRELR